MNERDLRIGVALGGGSARGYAHIGALIALQRLYLSPTQIVGTSFGAVVGALYATGAEPEALRRQAERMRRRDVLPDLVDFGLHRGALFRGHRLEAYFDRLLEGRSFEDLKVPLIVTATDADTGERVRLASGPLAPALRASASLPGVFAPVQIDGRRLIDGGIGAPVPVATLQDLPLDVRIGIGAGAEARDSGAIRFVRAAVQHPLGVAVQRGMGRGGATPLGRLARALSWTAAGYLAGPPQGAQVHTRPPIHWLRFDRAADAIRAGELAVVAALPTLLAEWQREGVVLPPAAAAICAAQAA